LTDEEAAPSMVMMRTNTWTEKPARMESQAIKSIDLFIDGLAEPTNPGTGTYGFVVYKDGARLKEGCGIAGRSVTNNFAEYEALIQGLAAVGEYSGEKVRVLSDSQLLVNQMLGKWKVKKGAYIEKHFEAKKLAQGFKSLEFLWIPRGMNKRADELTRIAYDRYSRHLM
jgi:ribonuclease HI